ncbi:MAG: D-alanyl-D-alanine carboxypeptidase family protein [Rhodospirillaceae bacterium]
MIVSKPLRALLLPMFGAFLTLILTENSVLAQNLETKAPHAFLIDVDTDTVLFEKQSDIPMPPASMSKLMTVYMVLEKLKAGKLSLNDRFVVSEKAWRKGGSKMFVRVNKRVSVRELLKGIIIQSGNDACIVIAEGLAGSEDIFSDEMTKKAKEIGLKNSVFLNSTGWPADGHFMSARDLALLAKKIISDFPEYYPMFAEKTFTFSKIKQGNRNPLLYRNIGADGLKTGHTEASGYGLVASTIRKGRRLILVVNGLASARERASESARLLDWGYRETKTYKLFEKESIVSNADVWLGDEPVVPLVIDNEVAITMSRSARKAMKAKIIFNNPVAAPIKKGDNLGHVIITGVGPEDLKIPVSAGRTVNRLGYIGRITSAAKYLLFGKLGS